MASSSPLLEGIVPDRGKCTDGSSSPDGISDVFEDIPRKQTSGSSAVSRTSNPTKQNSFRRLHSNLSLNSSSSISVSELLRQLAPERQPAVTTRLQDNKIRRIVDLAYLDKDDLKELGFDMLERSRILRWSAENFQSRGVPAIATPRPAHEQDEIEVEGTPTCHPRGPTLLAAGLAGSCSIIGSGHFSLDGPARIKRQSSEVSVEDLFQQDTDPEQLNFLDEVEERASFWCNLVASSSSSGAAISRYGLSGSSSGTELKDVRENMLEELFDISPERVKEVFKTIDKNDDGDIDLAEFGNGLQRCGVQGLPKDRQKTLLSEVSQKRGSLKLVEFETILTRLKLAQLLAGPMGEEPIDMTVIDYNALQSSEPRRISTRELKSFFFGHRPRHDKAKGEPGLIRWVHLSGLIGSTSTSKINLTLLLAMTVKYQLHPLGVEDVIEQCPTKLDRYGAHYFAAIEQLVVLSGADGKSPVVVCGRHTTISCAGPPHFDTVITVVQPDKSFAKDWPDAHLHAPSADYCNLLADIAWVNKMRKRLKGPRSRVRERRADFLMYEVVDLSTDDMVNVTQAFLSRLRYLEDILLKEGAFVEAEWVLEVSRVNLQLYVVSRRLRGLQRILRKWKEDVDVSPGLSGYLQDVLDHAEEAYDDTTHLIEKCEVLTSAYERAADRSQERNSQQRHEKTNLQDERMNQMLFILTIATFIFAPMQFMAGVYGMNFVDDDGKPTMPELLSPDGYLIFWCAAMVYILTSVMLAVIGWRRMMGNIDIELLRRFPHLAEDPDNPAKKNAAPVRNTAGMISLPSYCEMPYSITTQPYASEGYLSLPGSGPSSRQSTSAATLALPLDSRPPSRQMSPASISPSLLAQTFAPIRLPRTPQRSPARTRTVTLPLPIGVVMRGPSEDQNAMSLTTSSFRDFPGSLM